MYVGVQVAIQLLQHMYIGVQIVIQIYNPCILVHRLRYNFNCIILLLILLLYRYDKYIAIIRMIIKMRIKLIIPMMMTIILIM